nr:YhcN/YlaJ family sporulation lipoprotein [uncultured Bacillus sp.]
MQQYLKRTAILAAIAVGITGCNKNDDTALQDKRTDRTLPVGYYSNENHEKTGGNAIILDGADNDGPAVEILDHTLGKERETNKNVIRTRNKEVNPLAPVNNRNSRVGVPILGARDTNYHGHLNNVENTQRKSYENGYSGKFAERISTAVKGVPNVKDARTIVYGKDVIIAVQLENGIQANETKRQIQQAVSRHVDGRTVHYITNESRFNAVKVIDNDLKNGRVREQINMEIERLIRTANDHS